MAWFTAGLQNLLSEALLTLVVLVGAFLLRSRAASDARQRHVTTKKSAKVKEDVVLKPAPMKKEQAPVAAAPVVVSRKAESWGTAEDKYDDTQPNLLITAVRKGRVSELPYLLDAACERSSQKVGGDSAAFEAKANDHLLRVLRTCAASQQYAAGIKAYEHMKDRIGEGCLVTWSLLLYNAAECGENGMQFYHKIEACDMPSSQDFVNAVRCLAHSKDLQGLHKFLEGAVKSKVQLDAATRNRAVSACCIENALELGEVIAKSSAFAEPVDAVGINTLMKGFARVGKLNLCLQMHEDMVKQGIEATEMTYGILLDACITARDYDQAIKICESITEKGVALNKIHMTTVIKGLASSGQMEKAEALLKDMKLQMQIEPDIVTYQTLVKAHIDRGELDAALGVFQEMSKQDLQPDALIVDCVLAGCCNPAASEARIISVFDALALGGVKPSLGAVNLLVRSLAQNGKWQAAFDFLEKMTHRFGMIASANLHAQLGLACVKTGDMATASKVRDAIVGAPDFDKYVSCRLLTQCVQSGKATEAKAVAFGTGITGQAALAAAEKAGASNTASAPVELLMACSLSLAQRLSLRPQDARLAQFISMNHLAMESAKALSEIPPPMAEWVMDEGFILTVRGGNRHAAIRERIVAAERVAGANSRFWESYPDAAGVKRRIEDFAALNKLDQRCVETLKRLSRQQVLWVMQQEFAVSVDPSKGTAAAKVISNIRKAWNTAKTTHQLPDNNRRGEFNALSEQDQCSAAALRCALDDYIQINRLDERCSRLLRSLPPADTAWVMDQEFRIAVNPAKGTASAKVVGLVNKARSAGIGSTK